MNYTNLFGEEISEGVSIEDVASIAEVSPATVRNWIKNGCLVSEKNGKVSSESFDFMLRDILGKERLTGRANKLHKDLHDHEKLSKLIVTLSSAECILDADWWNSYEDSLSESFRNREGIYYTPQEIVLDMFSEIPSEIREKTFLDPCCGSGNFIIKAIEQGFKPENVFGFDSDENAIAITRKRVLDLTGYHTNSIVHGDFLQDGLMNSSQFDFIFTNPPWGKKLHPDIRRKLALKFGSGRSTDTSALFFFACLDRLNKDGLLSFLLPESFFNVSVFQDARVKALNHKILRLADYSKPFKGLVTKAQSITLQKSALLLTSNLIKCESNGATNHLPQDIFLSIPKNIFNFCLDQDAIQMLTYLYAKDHVTLLNNERWGLGIVTGNNSKFISESAADGLIPVIRGSDITVDSLKPSTSFIPADLSLYQQVAPKEFYEASEKLIYKFISSKLCFYHDTNQTYTLNSANMVILNRDFPITSKQLVDVLNCSFMSWLFKVLFNTHKVLRSDLESLPIYAGYFKHHKFFVEETYLEYLGIEKTLYGTFRIKSKNY